MEKLMHRWNLTKRTDLFIILFVFSITGSTSITVGRPILQSLGLTTQLNPLVYYPLLICASFVFYQLFLLLYGWLFGQFQFFWNMEKKLLRRFGLKL
ncbi:DUF6787 family protein [Tenacibaculum amylolyticum]|uniref:DUF6787 family protein n=1 Tax=Tenacibaculum amylolyticum TaxID=104269 RepID=UPI0038961588